MTTEVETSIEAEAPQSLADYKAERKAPAVEPEPVAESEVEKKDEKVEPPPKKGNSKIESRFSELTAKARAAEEKATAAEARAVAAEAKLVPKQEAAAIKDDVGPQPKPSEYTDAFEYAKDLAEWSTNKALKDRDRQDAEREANKAKDKVVEGWKTRVAEARAKHADFDDMLASSEVAVSDPARDTLIESEYGPDIVYALAADDELAQKVAAMKPADQVKWIGKMEAKLEKATEAAQETSAPAVKERPKAPAPITSVKATRSADSINEPGEFKGTYAQYRAQRLAQIRASR